MKTINSNIKDMSGKKFGKWTVIDRNSKNSKSGCARWNCICDCGKVSAVPGDTLRNGKSTNCGCSHPNKLNNITGNIYGKLKVLYMSEKSKPGKIKWICECECGNKIEIKGAKLIGGQKSCGKCNRLRKYIGIDGIEIELKKCTACNKYFPAKKFHKSVSSYDGLKSKCINCNKISLKKYRRLNCKSVNKRAKLYRDRTIEKQKIYRKRGNDKRLSTIEGRINNRMHVGIYQSLKGNKGNFAWLSMVPYSLDDLISRLNSTMPKNYSWDCYFGKNKIHIDHIIPVASFKFNSQKDKGFQECWALNNLQLLPAIENISKGAKMDYYSKEELTKRRTMIRGGN